MKKTVSLTEGNIVKSIMMFCLPIMAGTLLQQLYNTVDVIVVGKFIGANAIASVGGSSGMIVNLMIGILVGLSGGITVVVSRSFGAKNHLELKTNITASILIGLFLGLIFTVSGLVFGRQFLLLLDTPSEILNTSLTYIRIYFIGSIFTVLYNVASSVLRAMGDTKRPLYYLMVCAVVNMSLDILFVVILPLGVAGAALATITAQAVSAVISLRALMKLDAEYAFSFKQLKADWNVIREILWFGMPGALQSLMNSLSGMIMTASINALGTAAIAGNTSYAKLDQIFWMVSTSFAVTVATFVGQNLGAGDKERVQKGIKICLVLDLAISGVITVFFMTFGKYLFLLFTNDVAVIEQGLQVLMAIAPYYMLVSFYEILISAMRGLDDVVKPMIINIFGLCIIRIIWILVVLPMITSQPSIYQIVLSCPVSWMITSAMIVIYYMKQRKSYFGEDISLELVTE